MKTVDYKIGCVTAHPIFFVFYVVFNLKMCIFAGEK